MSSSQFQFGPDGERKRDFSEAYLPIPPKGEVIDFRKPLPENKPSIEAPDRARAVYRVEPVTNEELQIMLTSDMPLRLKDIEAVLFAALEEGWQKGYGAKEPLFLQVPRADKETEEGNQLRELVEKKGFVSGPEIDLASLSASRMLSGFQQIVHAFRALGVDAVGVVLPKRRYHSDVEFRLFYRPQRESTA